MKMIMAAGAALTLGLAACSGNKADNNAQNDMTVDTGMNTTNDNVATDNLTVDSSPSNVDQAINTTDQKSGVSESANKAADDVLNKT